jgi:hypothetical protein
MRESDLTADQVRELLDYDPETGVLTWRLCSEKHLHRYLAEFDFRYNRRSALGVEDQQRAGEALKGIVGKRLTYGGSNARAK